LQPCTEAYLDIETTGLTYSECEITVIGIHLCRGDDVDFVQLVGRALSTHTTAAGSICPSFVHDSGLI